MPTYMSGQSPVIVEIRYVIPEAGEVFLVWGINGWAVVPGKQRPSGTTVKDNIMYTPMIRDRDTFVATVQVPAGTTLDYGFLITKTRSGNPVYAWEANGEEDYHTIVTQDDIIRVQTRLVLAQDQAAASMAEGSLITQQIRYRMPEAGEVFLVWGINGWALMPEALRPPETVVKDQVMHTPMTRTNDTFSIEIEVPIGAEVEYGFLITRKRSGVAIDPIWEADGARDYAVAATQDNVIEVQTAVTLTQAAEIPSTLEITLYALIGVCILCGIGVILWRTRRLPTHRPSVQIRDTVQDCLFLSFVVILSLILYVWDLGFYGDDWSFLGYQSMSEDQSLIGLFRALYAMPSLKMRPVQVAYFSTLYNLFGLQPLGYHWTNASVIFISAIILYFCLIEIFHNRLISISVSIAYILLPNYSTDRFWPAAFQATLSIALYFLSLYSDLRALRASPARLWGWKLLSILSMVGSTLSYEVTIPLFLLNMLLVWHLGKQRLGATEQKSTRMIRSALLAGTLLILIATLDFKISTVSVTHLGDAGLKERIPSIVKRALALDYGDYDYGLNLKQAIEMNYGYYGLSLPRILWRIVRDYPNAKILTMGGVLGLTILGYLYYVASRAEVKLASQSSMLRLVAWGFVVFEAGYAVFLTNSSVMFSPTGRGNRTAIAASIGVALSLVGGFGWLSTLLFRGCWRKRLFCVLTALLCTSGILINNTLATFWIEAYRQQKEILAEIHRQFPTLPVGSTLILDGVCPYVGPTVVFDSFWDLAGALLTRYPDYTLRADVVTANLKIREDGLYTSLPGIPKTEYYYPYENLFIFNFDQKISYQINNYDAALIYFHIFNPTYSSECPQDHAEHGESVF